MTEALLRLLHQHSYQEGEVLLSSGKVSDFFIDCKQTVLLAEGHQLVAEAMHDVLVKRDKPLAAVAGVELGGCSLASAVAMLSHQRGAAWDAVYVRKEPKGHGSSRRLEGDSHLASGAEIAVLEDVVTTGGSTLRAVAQLREAGYQVGAVVAIVDREEGGAGAIRAEGLEFHALFRRADFQGQG
jgi:orotate phosphoribosyltransferase